MKKKTKKKLYCKNKSYSMRLNQQLVDRVKAITGLSPQNVVDKAYLEYFKLLGNPDLSEKDSDLEGL